MTFHIIHSGELMSMNLTTFLRGLSKRKGGVGQGDLTSEGGVPETHREEIRTL